MAKKNEPVVWRYVGNGAFVPGVPARDLTPAEMQEHAEIISAQSSLIGVPLYEAIYADQAEQPVVAEEKQ